MTHDVVIAFPPDTFRDLWNALTPASRRSCELWFLSAGFEDEQAILSVIGPHRVVDSVEVEGLGPCTRIGLGDGLPLRSGETVADGLYRLGVGREASVRLEERLRAGYGLGLVPADESDRTGTTLALERHPDIEVVRSPAPTAPSHPTAEGDDRPRTGPIRPTQVSTGHED